MSEVNDWNATDASNATLGSISLVEGVTTVDQINDIARAIMGANKRQLGAVNIATTIASAATTDLNITTGWFVTVTGTTTITALGTMIAGTLRILRFSGVLTLTHNATSLILPNNGSNIITAAGDVLFMVSLGSGNWRGVAYQPIAGYVKTNANITISNSAPAIGFTDTDTGADTVISGSSATGSLLISADHNDLSGSSQINFQVDGSRVGAWWEDGLLIGDAAYTGLDPTDVGTFIAGPGATNPGSISATTSGAATIFLNRQGSNGNIVEFYRSAAFAGCITVSSTGPSTAYLTSSDGRLKENTREFNSGAIIDGLDAWLFDWKSGGTGYGVIAQEAQSVFPDAVAHDEENDRWMADYSKYVPVLLREVKELRARLAAAGL